MKKTLLIVFSSVAAFLLSRYVMLKTHTLESYIVPTNANEPGIKMGSLVMASKFKKPERFGFICFDHDDFVRGEKGIFIYRICALEGDKVEIKHGTTFVNDKNIDSIISVKHSYRVENQLISRLVESQLLKETDVLPISGLYSIVDLEDKQVDDKKIDFVKRVYATQPNKEIAKVYGHDWTTDDFGPVTVPKEHYFVLGDNRNNACDSRYLGFIPKKLIVSVLIQ